MRANEGASEIEALRADIVNYEDSPDECTIYPVEAGEDRRTTAWITAKEGSFCSVESRV